MYKKYKPENQSVIDEIEEPSKDQEDGEDGVVASSLVQLGEPPKRQEVAAEKEENLNESSMADYSIIGGKKKKKKKKKRKSGINDSLISVAEIKQEIKLPKPIEEE